MYVYTGTFTYYGYAQNELLTLVLPRSFNLGDPALAYWHWTISSSGQHNQPTSMHGLIDSVTPSPYAHTTTLTLFEDSYYHLTLISPHPHPQPPSTLLMTLTSKYGASSIVTQLTLRHADDGLDLCRVYTGTLTYLDYALAVPIVFVLPSGKWGAGERIGAYWQWTVDGNGVRKTIVDYQGSVSKFVEEGEERWVECFAELYYTFVGVVRGEGGEEGGEEVCLTMWNPDRTGRSSEVVGRLRYVGVGGKTPSLFSPPSSSTFTFHLTTTFHPPSVTHPPPTQTPSSHHPPTPQQSQAGTWTDTRLIGSGGFGSVTLQTCSDRGDKLRAVKKLPLGMRGIDYHRELRALTVLSDRADLFIKFLGWYENTDFVYIAMEYLHHGDLAQYIETNPAGASTNARSVTIQLLYGLEILHKRKICHRDLKPPNVLLVALDPIRVKITDFGISKQMAGTQLRTHCGTTGYIAPEIMGFLPRSGGDYTDAVDMWALGTILHELLVGVIPFAEEKEERDGSDEESMVTESVVWVRQVDSYMLHRYCSGLMPFPEEMLVERGVGSEAREVVRGLMVPEPQKRWGVETALASMWLAGGRAGAPEGGHCKPGDKVGRSG